MAETVNYDNNVFTFIQTANGSDTASWIRAKLVADGACALGRIDGSTHVYEDYSFDSDHNQPITIIHGIPESLSNAGSSAQPIYVDSNGKIVACSDTVGSNTRPVFMSQGTITACQPSGGIGNNSTPIYMTNTGDLIACTRPIPEITYTNGILTIAIN